MNSTVFFKPTQKFFHELSLDLAQKSLIVEIGAGSGEFANQMIEKGWNKICPIDIFPNLENGVYYMDAVDFNYEAFDTVICARPCHSGFIQEGFEKAMKDGIKNLYYIGLSKNLRLDFDEDFLNYWDLELIAEDCGEDGECLWKIII